MPSDTAPLLSDAQLATVRTVVEHELSNRGATASSVKAALTPGVVAASKSNMGTACASGTNIVIDVDGNFPHEIVFGNLSGNEDDTVTGERMTVDATSGQVCDVGWKTAAASPLQNAEDVQIPDTTQR